MTNARVWSTVVHQQTKTRLILDSYFMLKNLVLLTTLPISILLIKQQVFGRGRQPLLAPDYMANVHVVVIHDVGKVVCGLSVCLEDYGIPLLLHKMLYPPVHRVRVAWYLTQLKRRVYVRYHLNRLYYKICGAFDLKQLIGNVICI